MIDPQKVTNFNRTDTELEEWALFCVCVAGKNAKTTAIGLNKLLDYLRICENLSPLNMVYYHVRVFGLSALAQAMKRSSIGCYQAKAKTCFTLAEKLIVERPDYLRVCTVAQLESIKGIGSKTARYFILHSRPNQRIAALDTHILKWLCDQGIKAPRTTPPKGSKKYTELELTFLAIADKMNISPAELDIKLWNKYSKNGLTYAR